MTSSSVADRAVPLNAARQSEHAVPERSLFLMAFSPALRARFTFRAGGRLVYARYQMEGDDALLTKYSPRVTKKVQCYCCSAAFRRIPVSFQRVMRADRQFAWHYRAGFRDQPPVIVY